MNNYRLSRILKAIACIGVAIVFFSLAVMLLWNWLIPEIFKGPEINFIQSLGILTLSKILFSSFGRGYNYNNEGKKQFWKQRFYEKVQHMSQDEREKVRNKFGRCFEGWENSSATVREKE